MNESSSDEGTFIALVSFPLWPVEKNNIIKEHQICDGRLIIFAISSGHFMAEIIFEHDKFVHPNERAFSCKVDAPPKRSDDDCRHLAIKKDN